MNYVISLGGSLIIPGKVDTKFLKKFTSLIKARVKQGDRFFIVTGGGLVSRTYQQALKEIANPTKSDLDWLGIASTKLNAELLRLAFGDIARRDLITDPTKRVKGQKGVNLVTGWKPGRSTDDDAVRIAKNHGVKTVINLSDVDYVYDNDPKIYKNTKKIKSLSWSQYLKQFGAKWNPGGNYPFDPVAASYAKRNKIKVVILNGRKLENFKNSLLRKKFEGTLIE